MIKQCILALLIFMNITMIKAQEADTATSPPDQLIGEWTIDLRPTPDAEGLLPEVCGHSCRWEYLYRNLLWEPC